MFDSTATNLLPLAFSLHSFDATATATAILTPQEWASESDAGFTVVGLPERPTLDEFVATRLPEIATIDAFKLEVAFGLALGALAGAATSFAGYVAILAW